MLSDKGTNIFSEIGKFFKENDATSAMNAIIDVTKVSWAVSATVA